MKTELRANQRLSTNKRIVGAGLFARTVSSLVDFAIVGFVGGLLIMGVQPIFMATPLVETPRAALESYQVDSNLFYKDEKEGITFHLYDTYQEYEDLIFDQYYNGYKVTGAPEKYRVDYQKDYNCSAEYWYNVNVLGLPDEQEIFNEKQINTIPPFVLEKGPTLFEYVTDVNGVKNYDTLAVKKADVEDAAVKNYYYISEKDNEKGEFYIYLLAANDLFISDYYNSTYNQWYLWIYSVPFFISFVVSAIVFLFIIPMCVKYGRSIGKLMFHLAVINDLGYDIKKRQIVLRFWFPILLLLFGFIVSQFFSNAMLAFLGYMTILLLVSYCLVIFTKDHKAIHDFIALTQVVNANESVWYENANQENMVLDRANSTVDDEDEEEDIDEELKGHNVLYVNRNYKKQKESNEDNDDTTSD